MSKSQVSNAANQSFGALSGAGKLKFIGKAFVFALTFGFAFPKLFGE